MTSNVGTTDRAIRIVLGIILIALGLSHIVTGGLAIAAYVVGAIALVTGVFRYCPAWSVFGINTCPLKTGQNK
jgi:uncharacterized membrane protein HdeD (DUF308 family)